MRFSRNGSCVSECTGDNDVYTGARLEDAHTERERAHAGERESREMFNLGAHIYNTILRGIEDSPDDEREIVGWIDWERKKVSLLQSSAAACLSHYTSSRGRVHVNICTRSRSVHANVHQTKSNVFIFQLPSMSRSRFSIIPDNLFRAYRGLKKKKIQKVQL